MKRPKLKDEVANIPGFDLAELDQHFLYLVYRQCNSTIGFSSDYVDPQAIVNEAREHFESHPVGNAALARARRDPEVDPLLARFLVNEALRRVGKCSLKHLHRGLELQFHRK